MKKYVKKLFPLFQSIILTFISYPIVIVLYGVFIICRKIVDIIIGLKLGEKYGGLLPEPDTLFLTNRVSKPYTTIVIILKSEKERDILNGIKQLAIKRIFNNPDDYIKVTGTVGTFWSYPYLIKNTCDVDNCIKPLPVPENVKFDENFLKKLTASLINHPLPQNDTVLWQILISQRSLSRNQNDSYYYYPIIIRIHHALTDGTSIMALMLRLLGDENSEIYYTKKIVEKIFKTGMKKTSLNDSLVKIQKFLKATLHIFFLGLGRFIENVFLRPADENALHGPLLTEDKIVAWTAEDDVKFVPLVKRVKALAGSKFSLIVTTAISAGLTNFFKRNSRPIPEYLTMSLPILLGFPKLEPGKPVPLENKFTCITFDLPLHNCNLLVETLRKLKKKSEEINYADIMVSMMISSRIGILPLKIFREIPFFNAETCIISNVPGGPEIKLLDGCVVDRIIPIVPHFNKIGISFGLLTYNDKFQIGIQVDKVFTQSQEEAQRIVDDIFYYMELFEKELTEEVKKDI